MTSRAASRSCSRSGFPCCCSPSSRRCTSSDRDIAPGRLPRPRDSRSCGHGHRDGQPQHPDRIRARLRSPQAARVDPARAPRAARSRRSSPSSRSKSSRSPSLFPVAIGLGWSPSGSTVPEAVGAVVLATLAFGGIGLAMAGLLRAEVNLAAANGLYLLLLLVSGMLAPLSKLPGWLAGIAKVLPAAPLSQTLCTVRCRRGRR